MTNREWLSTLSDKDLVSFWKSCDPTCINDKGEHMETACGISRCDLNSTLCLIEWLTLEHIEYKQIEFIEKD